MDRKLAFGLRLKAIRKSHKMSQEQFAELLDRSPDSVSNIECGRSFPPVETLLKLSEVLKRPLGEMFAVLDDTGATDPRRARLEAEIAEKARGLSLRDLKIVAKLIAAMEKAE